MPTVPPLPRHFCWTRYGTAAGETIEQIVARKERERQANKGIFLWGIGNSIKPSMARLLDIESQPEVVFSPTQLSRWVVSPGRVVRWTVARGFSDGCPYELQASVVTSDGQLPTYYALVCRSALPLTFNGTRERVWRKGLTNLGGEKKTVAPSQITACVVRQPDYRIGKSYPVSLRVRWAEPYLVELSEPEDVAIL
jgi:hypothetical protein